MAGSRGSRDEDVVGGFRPEGFADQAPRVDLVQSVRNSELRQSVESIGDSPGIGRVAQVCSPLEGLLGAAVVKDCYGGSAIIRIEIVCFDDATVKLTRRELLQFLGTGNWLVHNWKCDTGGTEI